MKYILLNLFILTLLLMTPVTSSEIKFDNTQVILTFQDGSKSNSQITLEVTPAINLGNINFYLEIPGTDPIIISNGQTDLSFNLVAKSSSYSLTLRDGAKSQEITSISNPSGVYVHLKHIYANWTIGTPTPDGRGFGQGVIADKNKLTNFIAGIDIDNSIMELTVESILNLVLGENYDIDIDGVKTLISDGYGLVNYLYGMRDHIRNAAVDKSASELIKNSGLKIVGDFDNYIVPSKADLDINLNTSTTVLALIVQNTFDLLTGNSSSYSNILGELLNLTNEFSTFTERSYSDFLNINYGINTTINEIFIIEDDVTSENNETPISLIFSITLIIIPIIKRRK